MTRSPAGSRLRILHVVSSLDPAGGGPMEVVLQSSVACQRMGHSVEVATFDRPDAVFLADFPLRVHALGPSRWGYGYTAGFVSWLRVHRHDYDAVIVNGLWQFQGLGTRLALRGSTVPYYVFPHGMLDPWFKKAYPGKHLKKWIYWPWGEYRVLRDARAVLFTCEEERRLARRSFWLYRANEVVVAFGTRTPPTDEGRMREAFLHAFPQLRERRFLLFLGRVHEKKGCDLLIEAFARIAADHPTLHLAIAGPDQTGLIPLLERRALELGIAERVNWLGMLRDDLKWGAFHAADAFVLPSHQENFGIAVAEALGCGVAVLISDKVNIWREIADADAGCVDTDTVDGCERILRRWLAMDHEQRDAMRARAAALFHDRFTAEAMASSLVQTIERSHSTVSVA